MNYIFNDNKVFTNVSEGKAWFNTTNELERINWLKQVLTTGMFYPFQILNTTDPSDELIRLIELIFEDSKSRTKLEKLILKLLLKLERKDLKNYDLIFGLLQIIQKFKISDTYDYIIQLAESKHYIGAKTKFGIDLQVVLLKLLCSLKIEKQRILPLFKSMISYRNYSFTSYRKLWNVDWENGISYLPQLINAIDINRDQTALKTAFQRFVNSNKGIYELLIDKYDNLNNKIIKEKIELLHKLLIINNLIEPSKVIYELNKKSVNEEDKFIIIIQCKIKNMVIGNYLNSNMFPSYELLNIINSRLPKIPYTTTFQDIRKNLYE